MIQKLTIASCLVILLFASWEAAPAQHKFTPVSLQHLPADLPSHIWEILEKADRPDAVCFDYCEIRVRALDALLKVVEVRIAAETEQARAIANLKIHTALVKAAAPIFAEGLSWRPADATKTHFLHFTRSLHLLETIRSQCAGRFVYLKEWLVPAIATTYFSTKQR